MANEKIFPTRGSKGSSLLYIDEGVVYIWSEEGSGEPLISGEHSIDFTYRVLTLVGDEASPNIDYFYGIDSEGNRVWRALPEVPPLYRIVLGDSGSGLEPVTDSDGNWLYGKFDALELEY